MSALRSALSKAGLLLAIASPLIAQVKPTTRMLDSSRKLLAASIPEGNVETIRAARALLERAITVEPSDGWLLHYLGYSYYREAVLTMGRDGADAGPILEKADEAFQRSASFAQIPETHALRSGTLGMMIGSSPIKGMTLGPRSGSQMERALELGPNNPRVWLLRGIGAMNTPAMFGGGLDKAEEYLTKSILLYKTNKPQAPAPDWGAHEAHAWLGQVYAKQGKKDAARAEYQRALAIEPNDGWVKYGLLPALDKTK